MAEERVRYESGMLKKWLNILQDMPALAKLGTPVLCATVYYPIALLKMRLAEYSYEDFDAVELSMLRFCAAGINTPAGLCRWMCLPSQRYAAERLAMLTAENLLQNGVPTPLGQDSLRLGRKKQLYNTEQIFQADGILGLLLPREFQKRLDLLKARSETRFYPHLMHSDAIATETIVAAIQGEEKIRAYKRYRKDILNVNVEQVDSIKLSELRYLLALLVQFDAAAAPVVFLPRHEFDRKQGDRFYSDVPLFLPQSLAKLLPDLAGDVGTVPDAALAQMVRLCAMLREDIADVQPQDVQQWLEAETAFTVADCAWQDGRLYVRLNVKEETLFSPLDLELLAAAGQSAPCPVELPLLLPTANGGSYRKYLTVWPLAGTLPPEAGTLAARWAAQSHTWLKSKAPKTYSEWQALLQKEQEGTDDERG